MDLNTILFTLILGSYGFTWRVWEKVRNLPCATGDVETRLDELEKKVNDMCEQKTDAIGFVRQTENGEDD